ncbi:hypothetical protein HanHA300_Chr16g0634031 [Helianthus annuus]|nr:hypothetical protein HanHA300_Chr16g0634031 [Helianthus annuus]KAJ0462605.1 hypothetical protein HanHA89_Chr16g0685201 [Helianthus annuus]
MLKINLVDNKSLKRPNQWEKMATRWNPDEKMMWRKSGVLCGLKMLHPWF